MAWSQVILYHDHSLDNLTSTSEADGYAIDNMLARIDGTLWKATSTATQYITFDAGSGNTYSPDYILLYGHNLYSASADVTLQYSTDNFSGDVNDIFTAETPTSDTVYLKTFTTQAKRYWRIKISGATSIPYITMGYFGEAVTLDFADVAAPYDIRRNASVNVGDSGYLQGIHEKHTQRRLSLQFIDADSTLAAKVLAWETAVGLGLFGIAWEPGEHGTEIWVMRRESDSFNIPLKQGGAYYDLSLDLVGRKE